MSEHLDLFKEAGEWAKSMGRNITPDMVELLGWLTGAVNDWTEKVEATRPFPQRLLSRRAAMADLTTQLAEELADYWDGVKWEFQVTAARIKETAAELRRLAAEAEALRADAERLKEHAVTLANTTFLATLESCAQLCESHFNHEAKDCADEIRALKDQA